AGVLRVARGDVVVHLPGDALIDRAGGIVRGVVELRLGEAHGALEGRLPRDVIDLAVLGDRAKGGAVHLDFGRQRAGAPARETDFGGEDARVVGHHSVGRFVVAVELTVHAFVSRA